MSAWKAVLLHNGNKQPSVPIAYSKTIKESREAMQHILDKLNYDKHKWKIYADMKVVGFLMGIQKGAVKYPCFLCECDSQNRARHYTNVKWRRRPENLQVDNTRSIVATNLVAQKDVIFPALHIMIGIATQFIKALVKDTKLVTSKTKAKGASAIKRIKALYPFKKDDKHLKPV